MGDDYLALFDRLQNDNPPRQAEEQSTDTNNPAEAQPAATVPQTVAALHLPEKDTGEKEEASGIVPLPPSLLDRYPKDPFHEYTDERMEQLIDSVREHGILSSLVVRPKADGRYEILSGKNRVKAAMQNGLPTVPCSVRDVDDDAAALIVTASNFEQRESILPSEKAFAYKMEMEALKNQGKISLFRGEKADDSQENTTDSHDGNLRDKSTTAYRYIRLTCLIPPLLQQVDAGSLSLVAAEQASYIPPDGQAAVHQYFFEDRKAALDLKTAKRLRAHAEKKELTAASIDKLLTRKIATAKPAVSIKLDKIQAYIPQGLKKPDIESHIIAALDFYQRHMQDKEVATTG